MATVNLGSIKFKWKGTYAGGTAYTIDDVVSYNGSSYICIQASTGNLPTNATYFEQMSSAGTNGTDGTDLGTTLTTQGDIVYRDASGLARLPAGSANQVLQSGGTGANPSWGTVSSDFVKLAQTEITTTTGQVDFTSLFSSTYSHYQIRIGGLRMAGQGSDLVMRWKVGSTQQTANEYFSSFNSSYWNGSTSGHNVNGTRTTYGRLANWNQPYTSPWGSDWTINLNNPTKNKPQLDSTGAILDENGSNVVNFKGAIWYDSNINADGLVFYTSASDYFASGTFTLYGIK